MMALWVQTLLLMAAAYFVGAALACMIRRSSSAVVQPSAVERRVEPLPEVVRQGAEAARFGRVTEPARAPRLLGSSRSAMWLLASTVCWRERVPAVPDRLVPCSGEART